MLMEAAAVVMTVDPSRIDPAHEGKLVHFTADVQGECAADPLFHVSRNAVRMKRTAEMYQWQQTEKSKSHTDTVGGGSTTEKTYAYNKIWSDKPIDSSQFHIRSGHIIRRASESRVMRGRRSRAGGRVCAAGGVGEPIDNFARSR